MPYSNHQEKIDYIERKADEMRARLMQSLIERTKRETIKAIRDDQQAMAQIPTRISRKNCITMSAIDA